jgi:hypothetical protein
VQRFFPPSGIPIAIYIAFAAFWRREAYMKKAYVKPNLKELGLLRAVTKYSGSTSQIGDTVYKGSNVEFTWQ